ncbi:MAG: hypothetical protein HY535_03190, partial [Chloroflexi bacterium]|nr:hypothetical protein [Chloroflexota bacterium]
MESDAGLAVLAFVLALLAFLGTTVAQAAFLRLGEGASLPWPERVVLARPARRLLGRYARVSHLFPVLRVASLLVLGAALVGWGMAVG